MARPFYPFGKLVEVLEGPSLRSLIVIGTVKRAVGDMASMREWKDRLTSDPVEWLLESKDPSLSYLVMTDLLDHDPQGTDANRMRERLMTEGPVARILSSQRPGGHWGREEDFYIRSKYRGTVWNVILLAQLGTDPEDPRVRRAGEFVLQWSQRPEGGFTHIGSEQGGQKLSMPCLSGNMIWSLDRLGLQDDPRVMGGRTALVQEISGPRAWSSGGRCLRCRSGRVKALKALSEIERSAGEEDAAQALCDAVIRECLPGGKRRLRPEWSKAGFPLMWNTDLVEVLDLISSMDREDDRAWDALDIILSGQDRQGRWAQGGSFKGRCLIPLESPGKPSRWATYRVLSMLKRFGD